MGTNRIDDYLLFVDYVKAISFKNGVLNIIGIFRPRAGEGITKIIKGQNYQLAFKRQKPVGSVIFDLQAGALTERYELTTGLYRIDHTFFNPKDNELKTGTIFVNIWDEGFEFLSYKDLITVRNIILNNLLNINN